MNPVGANLSNARPIFCCRPRPYPPYPFRMAAAALSTILCVPEDADTCCSKGTAFAVPEDAAPREELYVHTPQHGALTAEKVAADLEGNSDQISIHEFRGAIDAITAIPKDQEIWIIHCFMSKHTSYSYSYDGRAQVSYNASCIDNYGNAHAVYSYSPFVPWQQHCTGQPPPTFERWCKTLKTHYPDKYKYPLTDKTIDLIKAMPAVLNMGILSHQWIPLFATYATSHALAIRTPDALRKEEERRKEEKRRELEAQIAALQAQIRAL
jgi:hypothetical protein